jgi:allophanate hydrolase subunit 2
MMQSVLATRAATVTDFLSGIKGTLHVTFEECSHSEWLYDLLNSRVANLMVGNPRKNAAVEVRQQD